MLFILISVTRPYHLIVPLCILSERDDKINEKEKKKKTELCFFLKKAY